MKRIPKEKIKSLTLFTLIISSLVLIGIHWNQQAQGFPFRFLERIFSVSGKPTNAISVNTVESKYFLPESVIVSSGLSSQWKLEEGNSDYSRVWKDIKENYLPAIVKKKPDNVLSKQQWSNLLNERYIRIDFAANWPVDAVFWLENLNPKDFQSFESIKSIAIFPQKDVNDTVNTVFVFDNNLAYQYQINVDPTSKQYFKELADALSKREIGSSVMSAVFPAFQDLSRDLTGEEILVSLDSQKTKSYSQLNIAIPSDIVSDRKNIENIQNKILLNQKESVLAKYYDDTKEAIFTDQENYFKLYPNGLLEYKYLPNDTKDSGKPRDALDQALSFIEQRKSLIGNTKLVLTQFKKADIGYELQFGYVYKGVPIYLRDAGDDENNFGAPLTIKATGDRILECRWAIRSVTEATKPEKYSLYFADLVEKQIPQVYPEILSQEPYKFTKIKVGYVFSLENESQTASPSWIIGNEKRDYAIPLMKGRD